MVGGGQMMDYLYTNHGQNKNRLNEPFEGINPSPKPTKFPPPIYVSKPLERTPGRQAADKTWTNFKTLFITAYHKLKRQGGARQAHNLSVHHDHIPANIADTLQEIATKFDAEQQEMANFIQANTNLKDIVESCRKEIAALKITVDNLTKKVNNQKSGNSGSATNTPAATRAPEQRVPQPPKFYCYSCGLTNDPLNVSMNCPNPKPGHKWHATYQRRFGDKILPLLSFDLETQITMSFVGIDDADDVASYILTFLDVPTLVQKKAVCRSWKILLTYTIHEKASTPQPFESHEELTAAVNKYVKYNHIYAEEFANTYGWPIGRWNVSLVEDFKSLFRKKPTFNESIGSWDVSNATSMHKMFQHATSFNQDLSSWNVSNVESMKCMFQNATSFKKNLSSWNV
jgi:surface protein